MLNSIPLTFIVVVFMKKKRKIIITDLGDFISLPIVPTFFLLKISLTYRTLRTDQRTSDNPDLFVEELTEVQRGKVTA